MAQQEPAPRGTPGSPFDLPAARPPRERIWDLCLAIGAGGALGGALRHGLNLLLADRAAEIPWATLLENVAGSFVLGAVMVYLLDVWPPNRYLRPFLGVGLLGGFTTFSAYTSETRDLLLAGESALALLYLFLSPVVGLAAAAAGTIAARAISERPTRRTG